MVATTLEELEKRPTKTQLYMERYAVMRKGVVAHEFDVEEKNIDMLADLDFVFVAIDDNETRLRTYK